MAFLTVIPPSLAQRLLCSSSSCRSIVGVQVRLPKAAGFSDHPHAYAIIRCARKCASVTIAMTDVIATAGVLFFCISPLIGII